MFGCYTRAKRMTQAALIALPWLPRARAKESAAPRERRAPGTHPAQVRQPWHCSCSQSCFQTVTFSDKTYCRFLQEQEVITILAGFHLSLAGSVSLGPHSTPDCRQHTFPHPCSSIICYILHNIPPAQAPQEQLLLFAHSLATPGSSF